ncbi:hypothetical protein [Winogradskyella haliclonae]|uniref:Lipocalin-like domain-containing protein n=1 Tax=Winogradskyella haliclonae TaxID=2048558 RepID=A0ABQ2C061_9FLAO|nr:hypothetical protein [Winogradskyella haliclonae]GGI57433.1 hypothetical protein GCM10011444_17420 [Winogradskyella haliclonae]
MKKVLLLFSLLFILNVLGQNRKSISESKLIGYWLVNKTIKSNGNSILIYKRTNKKDFSSKIEFKPNGIFLKHSGLVRRCGNDNSRRSYKGMYTISKDKNQIVFDQSSKFESVWTFKWINKNEFAILKPKGFNGYK